MQLEITESEHHKDKLVIPWASITLKFDSLPEMEEFEKSLKIQLNRCRKCAVEHKEIHWPIKALIRHYHEE